ncbi:MAG: hypothetical protein R2912_08450 [Eubacteriales bacterium]
MRTNAPVCENGCPHWSWRHDWEKGCSSSPAAQIEIDLSSLAHFELSVDAIEIRRREAQDATCARRASAQGRGRGDGTCALVTGGAENTIRAF